MVRAVELTEEEKELSNSWDSISGVSGARVLRDFTVYGKGSKIKTIKAGTESHSYEFSDFHFMSEDGEDIRINSYQVSHNEGTYFEKIIKQCYLIKRKYERTEEYEGNYFAEDNNHELPITENFFDKQYAMKFDTEDAAQKFIEENLSPATDYVVVPKYTAEK